MILKTGGCWVKWKYTQTETIKPFSSKILHTSQCFRRSSSQEILYVLLYFYLHDAVQLMFFALCHQGYRYLRVQIRSLCLYIKHQSDYALCKSQSLRNKNPKAYSYFCNMLMIISNVLACYHSYFSTPIIKILLENVSIWYYVMLLR